MKNFTKLLVLFLIGGGIYCGIEMIYRSRTHWTMFILGGLCFLGMGLINEVLSWDTPLWIQMLIGGTYTTVLEFLTGILVNKIFNWNVWDYSSSPLNICGQVCVPFFFAWCGLSLVGIILDDYLRYWFFEEEKPRYRIF